MCRIGCSGAPMRVYNGAIGGSSWASVKEVADSIFGGTVEGRDTVNTEIGCALGKLLPPMLPPFWKRALCEKACRTLEGRGWLL